MKKRMVPLATALTHNIPETEELSGMATQTKDTYATG